MDVTEAEIKERQWSPRPGIGLALAGLALLAGVVFAFIPYRATSSKGASVDCGRALHAFRSHDPGPGLRNFLRIQPPPARDSRPLLRRASSG